MRGICVWVCLLAAVRAARYSIWCAFMRRLYLGSCILGAYTHRKIHAIWIMCQSARARHVHVRTFGRTIHIKREWWGEERNNEIEDNLNVFRFLLASGRHLLCEFFVLHFFQLRPLVDARPWSQYASAEMKSSGSQNDLELTWELGCSSCAVGLWFVAHKLWLPLLAAVHRGSTMAIDNWQ